MTNFLKHCLSLVYTRSKQRRRVSDWVNEVNEPDSVSHQPETNTVAFNNVVESFNSAVIPESTNFVQLRQPTVPVRSSADVIIGSRQNHTPPIGTSSVSTILRPNSTPPSIAAAYPLWVVQQPPENTTTNTVSSVTVQVASQQSLTRFPPQQPSVGPTTTMTQTSHVITILSAWNFPARNSLPKVHATIPLHVRGQVTLTSSAAAPESYHNRGFCTSCPNSKRRNNFLQQFSCDNTSNNNFTDSTDYNSSGNILFPTFPNTVSQLFPLQRHLHYCP